MKFVLVLTTQSIVLLVILSDLILLLLRAIVSLIRFLYKFFFTILSLSEITTKSITRSIVGKMRMTATVLISYLRKRRVRRQNTIVVKQIKQKKPTTLFLLPFRVKVKYFLVGVVFSSIFIFLPLAVLIFLQDLPSPTQLSLQQIPQTTKIYDRNGTLLHEIYTTQNRTLVPLSLVPNHLQQATVAIEDKNFYKHPGFDISSIIRALIENVSGRSFQGGSTITQQLIKSSILSSEPTLSRKIKEITLAFWAERIYSKPQILEMYFNQVPYGGTAWGVQAASEIYFGKDVSRLNIAESAFLAGITAAPSRYSPYGVHPTLWKNRQKEVLRRMVALGFISDKQAKEAEGVALAFKPQQIPLHAPHFVMYVRDFLEKKYGTAMVERGGLNVITSLDLPLQQATQKIVRDEVETSAYLNLTNGASVVTDPQNGDVLAMVGSKDFADPNGGNVNVTVSLRQPGSSIKTVTYSAALMNGFTAATIIDDAPVVYTSAGAPPYRPENYDGRYMGKVPLRLALANSLNIPAVKVLNQIGVSSMVNLGKQMGIKSWGDPKRYGLSITLGGAEVTMLDMATVNGTLANGGVKVDIDPILKITNYKGTVIEEKKDIEGTRAIPKGVAYIISNILSDNQARSHAFGPSSPLNIPGHTVSVKTGTSDNKRDNWTAGYTKNFVTIVWVGNNDNSPMSQNLASGITGAAPIWNKIMTNLISKTPDEPISSPEDIVQKICFGKTEYFLKDTEHLARCSPYANISSAPSPQPL